MKICAPPDLLVRLANLISTSELREPIAFRALLVLGAGRVLVRLEGACVESLARAFQQFQAGRVLFDLMVTAVKPDSADPGRPRYVADIEGRLPAVDEETIAA